MPKIDYSELQTVSAEVKRLRRGVITQFTAFTVANQTFQDSSEKLTGDSWDSARAYFSPYEEVASGIYNALYDVDDALSSYLNDFVGSVGAAKNRLDTDKLEELRNQLRQEQLKRNEINEALAAAFKDIPFIGNWFQENTMVETASEIAVLEKYQAFESAHAGDFSGLCTTLQAVKSGIEFLGSSGNFTGGKDGFKLVDYTSAAWYQTLKKGNDTAPKDRYEILEFADGVVVLKNGVQDPEKTAEYNWLITHKNWDMLKELGPEIIKIWLNLDDVEVLLDSESSTVQKSAASIFLLMSILPADEIEALIKTAKLLKNGDTTMDAIKLSSASWEALKEAHAAAKVVKKVEITDDVVDAGKVAKQVNGASEHVGSYLAKKAPDQVPVGTRVLQGQYVNDLGKIQPWEAHYDEFGRLVARTDYNAGNIAQNIPDIHYHLYEWGPGKIPYEYGSHLKGVYKP